METLLLGMRATARTGPQEYLWTTRSLNWAKKIVVLSISESTCKVGLGYLGDCVRIELRVPFMGIVITHENAGSRVGAIAGKHRLWCPGSCPSLLPFATYQTQRDVFVFEWLVPGRKRGGSYTPHFVVALSSRYTLDSNSDFTKKDNKVRVQHMLSKNKCLCSAVVTILWLRTGHITGTAVGLTWKTGYLATWLSCLDLTTNHKHQQNQNFFSFVKDIGLYAGPMNDNQGASDHAIDLSHASELGNKWTKMIWNVSHMRCLELTFQGETVTRIRSQQCSFPSHLLTVSPR